MRKKIAFVVQRYGLEVNGGSELSCRLIAERLSKEYDVEILTTKALDYVTWANHYDSNEEYINNVNVKRFPTDQPRDTKQFSKINERVLTNPRNVYDELEWMKSQGPVSFALLEYLREHHGRYHKVIFFTYLYFTTFFGLSQAAEKSIFVPTAHDEPYIYFSIFKGLFHLPRSIVYLTEEEKNFVHKTFGNEYIPYEVAGIGVDVPDVDINTESVLQKFKLPDSFILYAGRIDESKGCGELFDFYLRYKQKHKNAPTLVMIGKPVMEIPKDDGILPLGFVTDEEKFALMQASKLLIMPSKYESLSMVVLESLYFQTPVLVNGHSDVLVGHCNRGNAGLYYTDFEEFESCLDLLMNNGNLCKELGVNGKRYVDEKYDWKVILNKFKVLID
ncbi:glycosyltransferase family 1 protein [Paenibacillus sambharensis]|uniref:Glycosyltransferase family 1 protein n=1 Tax=Paenibacillus sambharensis TaxID=1803190 RepID=A0A2W1LAZ4_9BACL|nr:glycosyltransferase family 4 protein [Paenibacillus sambharensis]PZD96386.1 glycosyltransferase family 1 protein [Paenibacillus sambharensis]